MKKTLILASCISTALLSGCGGGGGDDSGGVTPSTTKTITVIDGYLSQAKISVAVNGECLDTQEYIATTNTQGQAKVTVGQAAQQLCAHAIAGVTVDSVRGLVNKSYTLISPASSSYITPYTDLVATDMRINKEEREAAQAKVIALLSKITSDSNIIFGNYLENAQDANVKIAINAIAESLVDLQANQKFEAHEYIDVAGKVADQLALAIEKGEVADVKPIIEKGDNGEVVVKTNHRPAATNKGTTPSEVEVIEGQPLKIDFTQLFTDSDGDSLAFSVSTLDGTALTEYGLTHSNGVVSGTLQGTTTLALQLYATDPHGERSYPYGVVINEVEDPAPVLDYAVRNKLQSEITSGTWYVEKEVSIALNLDGLFSDNGSGVTYSAVSDIEGAQLDVNGNDLTLKFTPALEANYRFTVKAKDDVNKVSETTFTVKVETQPPVVEVLRGISWHQTPSSVGVGQDIDLLVQADYAVQGIVDVTEQVEFTSSNPDVFSVVEGAMVRGVNLGKATLTASFEDFEITQEITVTEPRDVLTFDTDSTEIAHGLSKFVEIYYVDADGKRHLVSDIGTWSSDSELIKIENGKITALDQGTAEITFTYKGKKISRTIVLTPPVAVSTTPTFVAGTLELTVGDSIPQTIHVQYSDGTEKNTGISIFSNAKTSFYNSVFKKIGDEYVATWQGDNTLDDYNIYTGWSSASKYKLISDMVEVIGTSYFQANAESYYGYTWLAPRITINRNSAITQWKEAPLGANAPELLSDATLKDIGTYQGKQTYIYQRTNESKNWEIYAIQLNGSEFGEPKLLLTSENYIAINNLTLSGSTKFYFATSNTVNYYRTYQLDLSTLDVELIVDGERIATSNGEYLYYNSESSSIEKLDLSYYSSGYGHTLAIEKLEEIQGNINWKLLYNYEATDGALDLTEYTGLSNNAQNSHYIIRGRSSYSTGQKYSYLFLNRETKRVDYVLTPEMPTEVSSTNCTSGSINFIVRNGMVNGLSDVSASCSTSEGGVLWTNVQSTPYFWPVLASNAERWDGSDSIVFDSAEGEITAIWDAVEVNAKDQFRLMTVDASGNSTVKDVLAPNAYYRFYSKDVKNNTFLKVLDNKAVDEKYLLTDRGLVSYKDGTVTIDNTLSNNDVLGSTYSNNYMTLIDGELYIENSSSDKRYQLDMRTTISE
ncbi:DUF5050 domain-containing protein [Vibrio sp. SCSIO 43136]|uniref:DUF5050 domain-containing protein n=1 Tax=Vibrio sp. SCSIO 43136 TaxID=2819101 RepID=UPI002074C1E3|nr:DUF5050 domain-containing protein [Vibrio sp. SCSIO 43136]USD66213.1 hypothetical protein J4N39_05195 [Vibrio sp. SCSIO 43136]